MGRRTGRDRRTGRYRWAEGRVETYEQKDRLRQMGRRIGRYRWAEGRVETDGQKDR
jgi:hypothetical protein